MSAAAHHCVCVPLQLSPIHPCSSGLKLEYPTLQLLPPVCVPTACATLPRLATAALPGQLACSLQPSLHAKLHSLATVLYCAALPLQLASSELPEMQSMDAELLAREQAELVQAGR